MNLWAWLKNRPFFITLFRMELPTFYTKPPEPKPESAPEPAPAPPKPKPKPKFPLGKREAFIDKLRPLAKEIEREHGIPWLLVVTQAAHESRYGDSDLARLGNNLFGVTGDSWKKKGLPVVEMLTSEFLNNQWIKVRRPFRKYASYKESIDDWVSIIRRVHPNAYHAASMGDALKFFVELQKSGYATDPQYATKLDRVRGEVEGLA